MLSAEFEGVSEIQKSLRNTMGWSAATGDVDNFVLEDANNVFIEVEATRNHLLDTNPNALFRDTSEEISNVIIC